MVLKTFRQDEGCRFVIRPNRSLTWAQTKFVYGLLASVCLGVSAVFTALGFWVILPFAGAEVIALAVGFYMCAQSGNTTEIVVIEKNRVAIEKGTAVTRPVCEFSRGWARIALQPARIEWYPSRLLIGSHGKQVQLGAFLTEEERRQLAAELEREISSEADLEGTTAGNGALSA